eukprot:scaffold65174_cov49-Phaeocystis_antarctica.AAC.1
MVARALVASRALWWCPKLSSTKLNKWPKKWSPMRPRFAPQSQAGWACSRDDVGGPLQTSRARRASPEPADGGDAAAACPRGRAWAALQESAAAAAAAAALARRRAARRAGRRRDLGTSLC